MFGKRKNNVVSKYIIITWNHWAFALGLVCVAILLSLKLSRYYFPCVPFAFALILAVMIYGHRKHENRGLAIPYIVALSMLAEGFVLLGFNLTIAITDIYELAGEPVNDELPFIMQLSISPILCLVSGVFMLRRLGKGRFFRTSQGRSDVNLVQRTVWQETRYQTRLLFLLSLAMTLVTWIYTMVCFSSSSINRPDMFFFVWLPLCVYGLSLIYLGFRCFSLWAFYIQNDPTVIVNSHRTTTVRFLIVSGDRVYLKKRELNVKQGKVSFYDTPVRVRLDYTDHYSLASAQALFKQYTGIENGIEAVRFLFSGCGHGIDSNMFHYLCVLDSSERVATSRIDGGEWVASVGLRQLDYEHKLSAEFSATLVHLYSVAMAWKTYDINGNRRFKVKNYKPVFRLGEMAKWDVDFNDMRWLKVSQLNADKSFFKIRRFFSRLTSASVQ